MSKISIFETTAGCCCMTMRLLSPLNVKQFLASKLLCVIQHPLYSPDLAPEDSPPQRRNCS